MRQEFMCKATNNKQSGVSMVEVLVALVVMSVGMLGIASLYVTTLQAKTTSLSRMKAVNLAYDMADRIRANPRAGVAYVLSSGTTLAAPGTTCIQTGATGVDCSAEQMAAHDRFQWQSLTNATDTGLPGSPLESITRTAATATTPELFTILLQWTEPNAGTLNYSLQLQQCDPAVTPLC